ncbi:BrnT family toxin [Candidatus Daviesbacteria bacterium]|nr:BrnT family toxin [Candidatus Daviesbacteria bacterium]
MSFDFSKLEGFDWDKGNLEHIKSHHVDYRECEEVFVNRPLRVNEDKKHSRTEQRLQVLGRTNNHRLFFITFTIRKNKIRVVSARDQNKKERREYEETKSNT